MRFLSSKCVCGRSRPHMGSLQATTLPQTTSSWCVGGSVPPPKTPRPALGPRVVAIRRLASNKLCIRGVYNHATYKLIIRYVPNCSITGVLYLWTVDHYLLTMCYCYIIYFSIADSQI